MVDKIYLGVILVLILIIGYLFVLSPLNNTGIDHESAAGKVKSIYELQYESPAQVTTVEDTNGIYKVTVRFRDFTGQNVTQDIFVTKDGNLITDRFIIADNYKASLLHQKKFIECVRDGGVRILGQTNDTASLQQLQVLGTYSYKLFVSCDAANDAACKNLGVTRYPTTIYNNTGYANIYTPEFFGNLTGCTL